MAGAAESEDRTPTGVIHDLTNALGAADAFLELLDDGVLDPLTSRQREAIGRARSSVAAALRLTEEIAERRPAERRRGDGSEEGRAA